MKVIDLHGVRYRDIYHMIEEPCVQADIPFIVITGKSKNMKKIVTEIVSTFGLSAREKLGNDGRMVICERR